MPAFPVTTIPALPAADACLWQVHKKVEGVLRTKVDPKVYECKTGPTQRGIARLELKLHSAGVPCDQDPKLPPDGAVLTVDRGVIIYRTGKEPGDELGIFFGNFVVTYDRLPTILLGRITLIFHIGTHHEPFGGESCHQRNHAEGWLVGLGGKEPQRYLNALLVAKTEGPDKEGVLRLAGYLNGVEVIPR
jgi:hypothetical protein